MITWYMLFYVFMNDTLYKYTTSDMLKFQCEQMLDGQYKAMLDLGVPREHMGGNCIEMVPNTLEMRPDNSKPEFLK